MDWNWFFSSFSQSCAAIIGIIGAFVISKLLDINSSVDTWIDSISSLIIDKEALIRTIDESKIKEFNQNIISFSPFIETDVKKGEYDNLTKEDINIKLYLKTKIYHNDNIAINKFYNKYDKHLIKVGENEETISNKKNIRNQFIFASGENIYNRAIIDLLPIIETKRFAAKSLIDKFSYNYNRLNSYNSSLITIKNLIILLLIAILITVIYPLHFMPILAGNNIHLSFNFKTIVYNLISLRGFLLIAFAVIVFLIGLVLFKNITDLQKKIKTCFENKNDNITITNYCKYFY